MQHGNNSSKLKNVYSSRQFDCANKNCIAYAGDSLKATE